MSQAGLYVVATPIGNLEDISYRAVRILTEADLIAAEDTRHSRVLLSHYGIGTPMQALHEHNEEQAGAGLLERIRNGDAIALISDAGTPLISDPGYRLVCAAREAKLPIFAVPGPSAITTALSVAGLPPTVSHSKGFCRQNLLPERKNCRNWFLSHAHWYFLSPVTVLKHPSKIWRRFLVRADWPLSAEN
jgi:16S rRNA (cytidine1402-2'-O)-methyltransferase